MTYNQQVLPEYAPHSLVVALASDGVTHFLLPTLIAGSLHARLSSSLGLFFIAFSSSSWAAFKLCTTPLPLVASPRAWPAAGGRARTPTTEGVYSFHARMQGAHPAPS